jgi:hypothetical protein
MPESPNPSIRDYPCRVRTSIGFSGRSIFCRHATATSTVLLTYRNFSLRLQAFAEAFSPISPALGRWGIPLMALAHSRCRWPASNLWLRPPPVFRTRIPHCPRISSIKTAGRSQKGPKNIGPFYYFYSDCPSLFNDGYALWMYSVTPRLKNVTTIMLIEISGPTPHFCTSVDIHSESTQALADCWLQGNR